MLIAPFSSLLAPTQLIRAPAPIMESLQTPAPDQSISGALNDLQIVGLLRAPAMNDLQSRVDVLRRRSMEELFAGDDAQKTDQQETKVGQLILLRHGESLWNDENRFTGWANVDLTNRGREQALAAADLLLAEPDMEIDVCYTSVLRRSIETADLCLDAWARGGRQRPEVIARWRLNERHYGALTGLNKREALETMDATELRAWRASFEGRPPPMAPPHPHYSRTDMRYERLLRYENKGGDGLPSSARDEPPLRIEDVPLTESLADTQGRVRSLWESELLPQVLEGKNVLVVGHANCLRALISCIQTNVRNENLPKLGVPNALPLVYSFDRESGRALTGLEGRCYISPLDAHWLGDVARRYTELETEGNLPPEADNNGDGVVDFNEYVGWESRLEEGRGRGIGAGAGRIRG